MLVNILLQNNVDCCHLQDPDRTKARKDRKAMARRKQEAYRRRKLRQEAKDEVKFLGKGSSTLPSKTIPSSLVKCSIEGRQSLNSNLSGGQTTPEEDSNPDHQHLGADTGKNQGFGEPEYKTGEEGR